MTEWKEILKNEMQRNLDIGSTNYAKDLGNSVKFIQWRDDRMNPDIPKSELNALLDEYQSVYGQPIKDIRQITSSSGPNEEFVAWYNKKMGIKAARPEWMSADHPNAGDYA